METVNEFMHNSAYERLIQLAKKPLDLAQKGVLDRQRIRDYRCDMASFQLLYSTQRLNREVLDCLQQLADERQVVKQFMGMKKGDVINKIEGYDSEKRMVLHTAARDIFTKDPQHIAASEQAQAELVKLKQFMADLDSGHLVNSRGETFTDMVMVGIGGSDLGPRAIYLALQAYSVHGRRVHFISNVDPDDAATVLQGLNLTRTLVNVVSKSGSTLETLTNEELVRQAFVKAGLDPGRHFLAVTGKASPMDDPSRYAQSFYMYDYIGGRYSSTSMVGGVMLAFAIGYDAFVDILRGAHDVDCGAEEKDIRKNIPLLMAMLGIWNHNFLGYETLAVLPYSQALVRFTAHLQQCDMESNGKSIDRQGRKLDFHSGPVVWGEAGTNGQHAFYQLIHQGTAVVPVEFVGFKKSQRQSDILINGTLSQEKLVANLLAQSLALALGQGDKNPNRYFAGNRPNSILLAEQLTPYSMGALLAIYEAKIVFQGFAWDVNSFDQEGVQLGKMLANRLLQHMGTDTQSDKPVVEDGDVAWALLEAAGVLE